MPHSQMALIPQTVSFRDPVGQLILIDDRCFRVMTEPAGAVLQEFLGTDVARRAIQESRLIPTSEPASVPVEVVEIIGALGWNSHARVRIFEHEAVRFANYPYEWCPGMLVSAARLTLDLAQSIVPMGFNLKDGTPWNVMFRGTEPVFLDMASIEVRDPFERVWMPYGQFVRTFLLPQLVWRKMHVPPGQHFTESRDGLKPLECYRRLGLARAIFPPALELCTIPAALAWWADKRRKATAELKPPLGRSTEEAEYVVLHLLKRLRRSLDRVGARAPVRSQWTGYNEEVAEREFASGYFDAKTKFVSEALELIKPASCLDVGCNTGHFSLLSAAAGAAVVALDSDPASIDELYRRARAEHRTVLPLAVDFARPTPALGWNNSESIAFLDRAKAARFDLVMMLALIHHLCLIERVPLQEVAALAARLAPRWLLIEFVPREDPLAQLMPGFWDGDSDWSRYSRAAFEGVFGKYFRTVRASEVAQSGRWIYLMERHQEETA